MGDDESIVFGLAMAFALPAILLWYLPLLRIDRMICPWTPRVPLIVTPLLCATGLLVIVQRFADPQVRASGGYQLLFLCAGIAWLFIPEIMLPLLGVSVREDAICRRNDGAGAVCCCALLATSAVFAAANIGTGPTIYTTLGPAALGTSILIAAWVTHRLLSPAWEDVAVGRDPAAACRVGAFMLATAVVLLPAVAGNWVSTDATVHDCIRRAGPLVGIAVIAAVTDRVLTPTARWPKPSLIAAGLLPGSVIILLAVASAVWWR